MASDSIMIDGPRGVVIVSRLARVDAAIARFGRIDVLVNNAGNFFAGFFEELTPDQVRSQIETLLFGPMNVARAVLPAMRKQRSGLLVTISSTAGISGGMFCSVTISGWYAHARNSAGVGSTGFAKPRKDICCRLTVSQSCTCGLASK